MTAPSPSTRLRLADLLTEALAGLSWRPGRTAMSLIAGILGVAGIVATLGMASTAEHQVSSRFDALRATEVRVRAADPAAAPLSVQAPALQRLRNLSGVLEVGPVALLRGGAMVTTRPGTGSRGAFADVVAVDAGTMRALRLAPSTGRDFALFPDGATAGVAVVGSTVMESLGLPGPPSEAALWIEGRPYLVAGVVDAALTDTRTRGWVMVDWRAVPTDRLATVTDIEYILLTVPGAAQQVAAQAPLAVSVSDPRTVEALAPPDPKELRQRVEADTRLLFLVVSAVMLLVATLGMAATTLVTVIERIPEFGLRRTQGALPRHLAALVVAEAAIAGSVAGTAGSALSVILIVAVSLSNNWTPVMSPGLPILGLLLGLGSGALSSIVPALRASRVEPARALSA